MKKVQPRRIDGKTIEEWDRAWKPVDSGLKEYQPKLRRAVGLVRYLEAGRIMFIGTGTDKSGGIAKRLSDFIRDGDSGRRHYAGQLIYEHRHILRAEVLITGHGLAAQENGRDLKTPMVRLHQPPWNARNAPFSRKG